MTAIASNVATRDCRVTVTDVKRHASPASRALVLAAALLAVVAGLGVLVAAWPAAVTDLDTSIGEVLVVHGSGAAIDVLQVLTAPGAEDVRYPVLVPIAGSLLWFRRWRLAAFVAVTALMIAPLTKLLKDIVDRERPSYAGTTVQAGDQSFPSGHSSGAAVLAGVLLILVWPHTPLRWRPALVALAVLSAGLIAWTRLALGVHYLTDVLAGLALGAAVVLLAALIFGVQPPRATSAGAGSRKGTRQPPNSPHLHPHDPRL